MAQPRAYLPDPTAVANELKTQLLDNLGIRAELVVAPEETFLADVDAGKVDGIHLLGDVVSYPDASGFLDPRFGAGASNEFGTPFADIGKALTSGRSTVDAGARRAAYTKANDLIRTHVPMIPIARAGSAAAFRTDVEGAGVSPLRLERFAPMTPGDRRQLVWLTTRASRTVLRDDRPDRRAHLHAGRRESAAYDATGTATALSFARRCAPNKNLTVRPAPATASPPRRGDARCRRRGLITPAVGRGAPAHRPDADISAVRCVVRRLPEPSRGVTLTRAALDR
jgi:hypothetical protein